VPEPADYVDQVGAVIEALESLGLTPVLVGGMALVLLGSRRVTRDFDFVIAHPAARLRETLAVFYDRGFELVARLDDATGDVAATITSRRVAAIRLRMDAPASAYFFNRRTGLRIDLLFDFPMAAATLAVRALSTKVRSRVFQVASEEDLLQLKKIAKAARSAPGDDADISFLEARRPRR
jgi:hypothetical protein